MKKKPWKYLLAWLMVVCMAGNILSVYPVFAEEAAVQSEPIRVSCVGDSLTYGYRSSDPKTKSYPARLQELLGDGYLVQNFGRNSTTLLKNTDMPYVNQKEYQDSLASNPDIVIIMLGANDSKAKYWDKGGREQFASDAKELVLAYQNLPSKPRVIFATCPACYYADAADIRGNVVEDEIVPMQREIAEENGWEMIDMFALAADKGRLCHSDGHFNDIGYYYEAECMYAAVTGEAFVPEGLPVANIEGLSEHPGNEAKYAVDDDYTTLWHSEWEPMAPRENHVLTLELEERSMAEGICYLPRQDQSTNGTITEYEVQISNDGGATYTKAAEGSWAADASWKKCQFQKPMAATHIKLISKNAVDSNSSAAEIRIVGSVYTAESLSEARVNLQADYNSYQQRFTDETLYEAESWTAFMENMQIVQSKMNQDNLTLTEVNSIGKALRESVLSLQKKEAEPLDIEKSMKRKYYMTQDRETILPYRIYLPKGYTPEKKYPLVLYLHGAGERGGDNAVQLTASNYSFFEKILGTERNKYEAIIIAPQCPTNQQWVDTPWADGCYSLDDVQESNEMQAVEELLSELQKTYSINKNRIYAVGFSMGGFGVWDLMMRNPDLLAAAVPIAGAGDPTKAEQIKDVPIWCSHGTDDTTVPYAKSTPVMAEALQTAGSAKMCYTEYAGKGHLIVSEVCAEGEFLSWLFGQKKEMEVTDLSDAVLAAENKDPNLYTEESYQAFLEALSKAWALLADDSAQQDEIDNALLELEEAERGLKEKPKEVMTPEPLKAPEILSVSRKSKSITVSWSPVSNASGYEVSYCTTGGYTSVLIMGQSVASYQLNQTNANTVYQFRIRAYRDVNGQKYYSDYSAWNTKSVDIPKVKSVSAKKSGKAIRIKWKKILGASGYKILRGNRKKGKFKVVGTIKKGKKVTFLDKKVKAGKQYYYKVCAISKSGAHTAEGPLSAAKSAKF